MCFIILLSSINFNSIKVRLEHNSAFDFTAPTLFQFHKGTIRTVASKTEISANAMVLWVQSYKKCFEKMSMVKSIFFLALRQPFIFLCIQYVKERNLGKIVCWKDIKNEHRQLFIRNCLCSFSLFLESVYPYCTPFCWWIQ